MMTYKNYNPHSLLNLCFYAAYFYDNVLYWFRECILYVIFTFSSKTSVILLGINSRI